MIIVRLTAELRCLTFLTTWEDNGLSTGQAHAALAAALLRQLHLVVTLRVPGMRPSPPVPPGPPTPGQHASSDIK